jgi:putative two-component system response regulator
MTTQRQHTEDAPDGLDYDESLTDHLLNRMAILAEQHLGNNLSHIRRVSLFSQQLGNAMGLDPERVSILAAASRVHDIGMIQVPAKILNKPDVLTKAEKDVIHQHIAAGLRLVGRKREPLIQMARTIIASHHERHDGSGYPDGIKEDEIPVEGRIVAIADTFDALCTPRPYRRHTDPETAISIIMNGGNGIHFHPDVVKAFSECRQNLLAICNHYPHR